VRRRNQVYSSGQNRAGAKGKGKMGGKNPGKVAPSTPGHANQKSSGKKRGGPGQVGLGGVKKVCPFLGHLEFGGGTNRSLGVGGGKSPPETKTHGPPTWEPLMGKKRYPKSTLFCVVGGNVGREPKNPESIEGNHSANHARARGRFSWEMNEEIVLPTGDI